MINTIRGVHISPFTSGERNDFIYQGTTLFTEERLYLSSTIVSVHNFILHGHLPNKYGMQTRIKEEKHKHFDLFRVSPLLIQ